MKIDAAAASIALLLLPSLAAGNAQEAVEDNTNGGTHGRDATLLRGGGRAAATAAGTTAGTVAHRTLQAATPLPWLEDFTGLANGLTADNGTTAWTAVRTGVGKFAVVNGTFSINDGGSEGVLTTAPIGIAGAGPVAVTLQVSSQGSLETNQDYARLYYKLNGGPEVLIGGVAGNQPAPIVLSSSAAGISGTTLVLVIRAYVSWTDEYYFFDNLKVAPLSTAPTSKAPTKAPVTKAPVAKAPTKAPTKVPVTKAPTKAPATAPVAPSSGVTVLSLVANRNGVSSNVMQLVPNQVNVVSLAQLNMATADFTIDAQATGSFSKINFDNGHVEGGAPYARCGNTGPSYFTCTDLAAGTTTTVWAQAVDGSGLPVGNKVTATLQIPKPTAAPSSTRAPSRAPITSPLMVCDLFFFASQGSRQGEDFLYLTLISLFFRSV
jgi:hypothetical protein